ncbi:hypothetical protein ACKGJI_11305 [Sulfurospirillum sp. 1307]|jgi:hypothetical protein
MKLIFSLFLVINFVQASSNLSLFTEKEGIVLKDISNQKNIYVFQKEYKKLIKSSVSWNNDKAFVSYGYKDKNNDNYWEQGGIYNTKTSQLLCKNFFDIDGKVRNIGWLRDDLLYVLSDKCINYYVLEDEDCIKVGTDYHGIKELNSVNKVQLENNTLILDKKEKIDLRVINQDTVAIYRAFDKISKLLRAGFEKRGLRTIDRLVDTQYKNLKVYHQNNIKVEKNKPAYTSYYLAKNIKKCNSLDENLYDYFRVYLVYAYWNGYYEQAKEMTEYIKSLKISQKKFKDLISLSDAMYLICIGKDEGYDILFDMQPISKELKSAVEVFTRFQTPFSKNINKLIASLDMKKSEFGKNSVLNDRNNIFFDLNGNKITNGKKIEKKVLPETSKKSKAIKLLD